MTLSSLIITDTIEKPAEGLAGPPKPVLIVRRLLNAGATLYYQFAVFDAGQAANGERRVKAGHVVRRADGTVVKELQPTPLAPWPDRDEPFRRHLAWRRARRRVQLVVTVTDEIRGQTLTVTEPFAVAEAQRVRFFQ